MADGGVKIGVKENHHVRVEVVCKGEREIMVMAGAAAKASKVLVNEPE